MNDEDIFDDTADEMLVISQEWKNISKNRLKEGFISGASDGQTSALQDGFNQGFKTGFSDTFLLSKIKGLLNGLLAYHEHYEGNPITNEVLWETQSVLASIEKLETDSMLNQFSTIGLTHQDDENMMDCDGEQSAGMGSGGGCGDKPQEGCGSSQCCRSSAPSTTQQRPVTTEDDLSAVVQKTSAILKHIGWKDVFIEQFLSRQL